jgi:hypothetical protein
MKKLTLGLKSLLWDYSTSNQNEKKDFGWNENPL